MQLESLKLGQFQKLTSDQMSEINGGWVAIYTQQHYGISSNGQHFSGEYGYPSFLGVRTGANEFRITDTVSDEGWS